MDAGTLEAGVESTMFREGGRTPVQTHLLSGALEWCEATSGPLELISEDGAVRWPSQLNTWKTFGGGSSKMCVTYWNFLLNSYSVHIQIRTQTVSWAHMLPGFFVCLFYFENTSL